jgi:hypothetical protein
MRVASVVPFISLEIGLTERNDIRLVVSSLFLGRSMLA